MTDPFPTFAESIHHDRVRNHTSPRINERIELETEGRIARLVRQGREALQRRIADLDREWDVDRALMASFVPIGGAVLLAGLRKDRRWLPVFGVQMGFLLAHATVGWCPPTSLLRRLGFRTRQEIEAEKRALRTLSPA